MKRKNIYAIVFNLIIVFTSFLIINNLLCKINSSNVHAKKTFNKLELYSKEIPIIWTSTEVISTESNSGDPCMCTSGHPSIAVDVFNNVHVVWADNTNYNGAGGDWDIFYKFWNATTEIWATTQVISTESTDESDSPVISVDVEGNVHIAWQDNSSYAGSGTDYDIYYKFWNTTAKSWNATEVISSFSNTNSWGPSITVDIFGNVHLSWSEGSNYFGSGNDGDIFYRYWNVTTGIWNGTVNSSDVVSTESPNNSHHSSITTDSNGNVHLVWFDQTDIYNAGTDWDVFYKCWNATTGIWNGTINKSDVVSTESTDDSADGFDPPTITVDNDGNIHVAWCDNTSYAGSGTDYDIFYKFWNATAKSWNATTVLSIESTENSHSPTIAVDLNGDLHIAWHDETNYAQCGWDADIFYKFFNASSMIWSSTEAISTQSTENSNFPRLAVNASGIVHVVWQDYTNYGESGIDIDIFYKKKGRFLDGSSSEYPPFDLIFIIIVVSIVIGIVAGTGGGLFVLYKRRKVEKIIPIYEKELISCKRQFEFFSGFVRIKLKLINSSSKVITDVRINFDIPHSFKLIKVEPLENFKKRVIFISDIQPNLEKTLNIYLEPLVCGKERIYGDIKYLDAAGSQHLSTISPLEVQVVCPMFFTEEEANVAMVKNLMEKKLHLKDERSYGIPRGLEASLVHQFLKESIQQHHVKFVHESMETEPTFESTLYFFGKTKIKKNDFVIKGVISQKNSLVRIIIATIDEAQLIGLLAEIGANFRQKVIATKIILSEGELISLRCPHCAAILERILKPGERCPYCDKKF